MMPVVLLPSVKHQTILSAMWMQWYNLVASMITDGVVGMIRCMPTQPSDDTASAIRIGLIYDYFLPLRAELDHGVRRLCN